jgi:WD40 repeat protein
MATWSVASGEKSVPLDPTSILAISNASQLGLWAAALDNGQVEIRRLSDGTLVKRLSPASQDSGQFLALAFHPNGNRLLAADEHDHLSLWEVPSMRLLRTQDGPPQLAQLANIAFSPDGRHFVQGGSTDVIRVRDTATGNVVQSLAGHVRSATGEYFVNGVAFRPDGRWLATCGDDATVRIWEVTPGREYHEKAVVSLSDLAQLRADASSQGDLPEPDTSGFPAALAFSADSQQLAVAAGKLLIFDTSAIERRVSAPPEQIHADTLQLLGLDGRTSPATPRVIHHLSPARN